MAIDDRDFLTVAQEGLEQYLTTNPRIKRIVRAGVINAYTKTRATNEPDVKGEKDLPLIRLVPVSMPSNLNFASNCVEILYTLRVELVTGDMRFTGGLAQLWSATFAALAKCVREPSVVTLGLTWKDEEFIKNVSLSNSQLGVSTPEGTNINGWVALCDVTLHMYIPTTSLVEWSDLE